MDDVGPDQQRGVAVGDLQTRMARRVARQRQGGQAGRDVGLAREGLDPVAIGREEGAGAVEGVRLAGPVGVLVLVQAHRCALEDRAAVGEEAADMVAVHVGDEDRVDVAQRDARGREIVRDPAGLQAHRAAAAGIDEHRPAAGLDDIGVEARAPGIRVGVAGAEDAGVVGLVDALEIVQAEGQGAVGEGGR